MATSLHFSHLPIFLLLCSLYIVSSDLTTDRTECSEQLVGLSTCLSYVQGHANYPSPDCCSGLKQVLGKSPKCLCVLIKDRDDPNLGIKINVSLALDLPTACKVPSNISECPRLLKLPPNSKDAEIFVPSGSENTVAQVKGNSTKSGSGSRVEQEISKGSRAYLAEKAHFTTELVVGCFLLLVMHSLFLST
ncbi:non-specific lipid transfer protein GPI-anchored 14-like [Typha angustifolia]|uniref:non-specific lipid transfer protein GPI-anchored 14-like n=1 Tax=Typha angustifolia TaxID=59011 RepID=UPI003C2EE637